MIQPARFVTGSGSAPAADRAASFSCSSCCTCCSSADVSKAVAGAKRLRYKAYASGTACPWALRASACTGRRVPRFCNQTSLPAR